jgi:hypothetical protein
LPYRRRQSVEKSCGLGHADGTAVCLGFPGLLTPADLYTGILSQESERRPGRRLPTAGQAH